jgi:hypothetical protein
MVALVALDCHWPAVDGRKAEHRKHTKKRVQIKQLLKRNALYFLESKTFQVSWNILISDVVGSVQNFECAMAVSR